MRKKSDKAAGKLPKRDDIPWVYVPPWRIRWGLKAKKWFPVGAQIVTILISLVALVIFALQAWIYEEQRKLMYETRTLTINQTDVPRRAQRAYPGTPRLNANIEDITGGQVRLRLENTGETPADMIRVSTVETRSSAEGGTRGSLCDYQLAGQQLLPGRDMVLLVPLPMFEVAEKETLYLRGRITYEDGFGRSDATEISLKWREREMGCAFPISGR